MFVGFVIGFVLTKFLLPEQLHSMASNTENVYHYEFLFTAFRKNARIFPCVDKETSSKRP